MPGDHFLKRNIKEESKLKRFWKFITDRNGVPRITIIIPVLIYEVFATMVPYASRADGIIMLGATAIPLSAFSGVFSAFANLCLILMVVLYRKVGAYVAVLLAAVQFPKQILAIIAMHNLASMPGLIMNFVTIVSIIIIYLGQNRIENEQHRLRNLFEQTATALVNAIDAKDKYTHGHSARVANYSKKLAQVKGKSDKECDDIYYAALLHDVGKIGIPVSIINKGGKLSEDEYEYIKQHPALGAQVLETIKEYPFLKIGANYHHERYDGKGYPEGLKGDDIPEMARIISVADAYDAMTSKRSYRDPLPQQKVREEIVKGLGTQFDPEYGRLMIRLIDIDTEYEMKEWEEQRGYDGAEELRVEEYRSSFSDGIYLNAMMSVVSFKMSSDKGDGSIGKNASMILFDSLNGSVQTSELKKQELLYLEYGEIRLDGRVEQGAARKINAEVKNGAATGIKNKNEYRIEAVRIKDHALIRLISSEDIREFTIALPDSTRFMYIALTGSHCHISDMAVDRAEKECPVDYIPRIAEEISYINVPDGDIPNIQVDGDRTVFSRGIALKDGLRLSFHTMSLPTARLVWHCPLIDLFYADDGKVSSNSYRELAFMRLDGEFWESDPDCKAEPSVVKTEAFQGWKEWIEINKKGYDVSVSFKIVGNRVIISTENAGIEIRNTALINNINKNLYIALSGDQCAITNIRIQ